MKHNLQFLLLSLILLFGQQAQVYAQCTNCTYTAPSGGTSFNFNGNETLCITANASNLGWNMNGTGNKICVATGVAWDQPFGGNLQAGTVIEVYGTLNLGNGFNVNGTPPNAVINVHAGGTLNHTGGFGNGLTINNDGIVNFTSSAGIDVTGSFILNNSTTGTINALTTTNFKLGNNATINNNGTLHFANFENEEGYLNNNVGATLLVDRSMNNHGAFINNGDFQLPCTTLPGAAGATTCSFRVGDKGVGKEFITSGCFCVTGNVIFDGVGTINGPFVISDGNLTINKNVTGTNGWIKVKNGVSTLALNTTYAGTNLKFCDVNTAGNGFDVVNTGASTNATIDCGTIACACDGGAVVCTLPTITPTITPATCTGSTANSDAKIEFTSTNGDKYTITQGANSSATYAAATALTAGSGSLLNIANPASATQYTIRVFNGDDACFKDTTVTLNPVTCTVICTSPAITPTVSQATCTGSTANSDAKIEFTSTNGDKYAITQGATSTATYAAATALTAGVGSLLNIANPASATQYTIRVFNGSDGCNTDISVSLVPKICIVPCPTPNCGTVIVQKN